MFKPMLILVLAAALCISVMGVNAQLTAMSYGFPTIVQSSNTVAFNQDTANAMNYQDVSIDFPTAGGLPFGAVSLAFPSIHQTSLQVQSQTHTDYTQTNSFAEFAYPSLSVGAAGLPAFGF